MIVRDLQNELIDKMSSHKVLLIFGTRRVGKTVLIKEVIKQFSGETMVLNGEDDTTYKNVHARSMALLSC